MTQPNNGCTRVLKARLMRLCSTLGKGDDSLLEINGQHLSTNKVQSQQAVDACGWGQCVSENVEVVSDLL